MAYQAVGKIAVAVSKDLQTKEPKGTPVLIANQANLSNLAAFMTFLETSNTITEAYNQKMPVTLPTGEMQPMAALGGALGGADLGPTVSGMAALLALFKASTSTYPPRSATSLIFR
jgi:hypothetical protein